MTVQAIGIGHNQPPSPFEHHKAAVTNLYDEAVHWLDGEPIDSVATAEGVATLMREIRKAGKAADTARKEEKAPHATAVKEIDTRWKAVTTLATAPLTARWKLVPHTDEFVVGAHLIVCVSPTQRVCVG